MSIAELAYPSSRPLPFLFGVGAAALSFLVWLALVVGLLSFAVAHVPPHHQVRQELELEPLEGGPREFPESLSISKTAATPVVSASGRAFELARCYVKTAGAGVFIVAPTATATTNGVGPFGTPTVSGSLGVVLPPLGTSWLISDSAGPATVVCTFSDGWGGLSPATSPLPPAGDFTSTLDGLAPASGGGTSNFLRADGTWVAPVAGVTGSGTSGKFPIFTGSSAVGDSDLRQATSGDIKLLQYGPTGPARVELEIDGDGLSPAFIRLGNHGGDTFLDSAGTSGSANNGAAIGDNNSALYNTGHDFFIMAGGAVATSLKFANDGTITNPISGARLGLHASNVLAADVSTTSDSVFTTAVIKLLESGDWLCHAHVMFTESTAADGIVVKIDPSDPVETQAASSGILIDNSPGVGGMNFNAANGGNVTITEATFTNGILDADVVLVGVSVHGNVLVSFKEDAHTTGTAKAKAGSFLRCEVQ